MAFATRPDGIASSELGLNQPKLSESDAILALKDVSKDKVDSYGTEPGFEGLVAHVKERQSRAELYRRPDEIRWVKAYRNYRGEYGSEVMFTETEKSRVFIKITKTKVIAAYGQIIDVLFSGGRFPIGCEPSKLPEGVPDTVHVDPKEQADPKEQGDQGKDQDSQKAPSDSLDFGYAGDGRDVPPGATLKDMLGTDLAKELDGLDVEPGPGLTPSSLTYSPADMHAKKMEKKILDQLDESNASKHLRYVAFEMALLGTGIIKGPFASNKELPKWDEDGTYDPLVKTYPKLEAISIWNYYPDPDGMNQDDLQYAIQRHRLNRTQMRALKKRPYFRENAIEQVLNIGYNYQRKWWENEIRDQHNAPTVERFEVLEYWGVIDRETLEDAHLEIPSALDDFDEIQVNVWVCGDNVIRLVINPFVPARIPYAVCPYELNPYSIFGVGVAENMEDTQTLMNGFMRMTVDNAVLSGNLVFEVDETNLVPGQDLKVYPGKIFRRIGGAPGQSLFAQKYPNTSQENMFVFDKARQLADEATGMPSYAHGQTGVSGTTRTASGMSMLMGAASTNIKTVIKNCDDYLLRPVGEAFFHFNMQFDFDPDIKGDLEIKAKGTESLMQNEVRSQRLMTFLQTASSPILAPFAKFPFILREIAKSMELDPEKVCNNPDEAMRQAMIMQQHGSMQAPGQPGQPPQATPGAPPSSPPAPGANPQDLTGRGGGNAGTAGPPMPGQPQFSGNAQ